MVEYNLDSIHIVIPSLRYPDQNFWESFPSISRSRILDTPSALAPFQASAMVLSLCSKKILFHCDYICSSTHLGPRSCLLKRSSKVRAWQTKSKFTPYIFIHFPSKWSEIHWSCCTKDLSKRSNGLFGVCTVRLVGRAHSGQRHRPASKLATLQDISR